MKTVILIAVSLVFSTIGLAQNTFTKTEHVRFSADGKQVIFSSAVYEASTAAGVAAKRISARIALMNIDGSNLKFVTSTAPGMADACPVLSSDGKKILFRRDKLFAAGEPGDIYTINTDGTGLKQLSAKPEHETNPEFTADGKAVIYVREYFEGMGKPNNGELINVDINSGKEKILLAKEMKVVQAVPLTIGRGGYLVACGLISNENKNSPIGSMLILVSPDGEISPKSKTTFPDEENLWIKHIRVVQQSLLTVYIQGRDGDGWMADYVNYKFSAGKIQPMRGSGFFADVSLSPDGRFGAQGTDGVASIKFYDFNNDEFTNRKIVSGK